MAALTDICITIALVATIISAFAFSWPLAPVLWVSGLIFFLLVLPRAAKAFIDWKFDFIIVTTDKLLLVDQTSLFSNEIKPILFDNVGGVGHRTQWLGLVKFGELVIALKEGEGGGDICRRYVPNARETASLITEAVETYQRKQYGHQVQQQVTAQHVTDQYTNQQQPVNQS